MFVLLVFTLMSTYAYAAVIPSEDNIRETSVFVLLMLVLMFMLILLLFSPASCLCRYAYPYYALVKTNLTHTHTLISDLHINLKLFAIA